MKNKIEVMAFSLATLNLENNEIFSYFQGKNANYNISNDWIISNDLGPKIKILKTGIAETKEFFDENNIKDKLNELTASTHDVATHLFCNEVLYDVMIFQNKNINLKFLKNDLNEGYIESILIIFEKNNIWLEIKSGILGYWIIMKGIIDVTDIFILYNAIQNEDIESLKRMGFKKIKAIVN